MPQDLQALSSSYYISGGKLGPEDDMVPEIGPVRRIIIFPEGNSVRRAIYMYSGLVRSIILYPEGSLVRRTMFP